MNSLCDDVNIFWGVCNFSKIKVICINNVDVFIGCMCSYPEDRDSLCNKPKVRRYKYNYLKDLNSIDSSYHHTPPKL